MIALNEIPLSQRTPPPVTSRRGTALVNLGRPGDAIPAYVEGGTSRELQFAQALANLMLGRFAEGWALYEARNGGALGGAPTRPQPKATPWLGVESLFGRTIYVRCSTGLGDTIQFCRYALLLKLLGAAVILQVQNTHLRLIGRLDPDFAVIGEADGDELNEQPTLWSCWTPVESLPLAFKTRLESIPAFDRYLSADPLDVARWADRLGNRTKPRIGIVWAGNPYHGNDHNRSMTLADMRGLFAFDAEWICPQKALKPGDAELLALSNRSGCFGSVRFFGDDLHDFAETAALIESLDLVISVDTSIAHLAGAMGKPVWILLPHVAEWRWLMHREDSPWYPTARLFRQPKPGDWASVIDRVAGELARLASDRSETVLS